MHEQGFTEQIVDAVLAELSVRAEGRPRRVRVRVGEALHLNAESVRSHFRSLAAGTSLEGALLDLEEVPMTVRCRRCLAEGTVEDHHCPLCPACGSADVDVVSGNDVVIETIELEERP